MRSTLALAACLLLISASPAALAQGGTGTQVVGTVTFSGGSDNCFADPTICSGTISSSDGNAGGNNTVTIGSGVEFGFQDASHNITADFTGSTLEILESDSYSWPTTALTFTDPAFASFTATGGSIPTNNYSLSGDTLTIDVPAFSGSGGYVEDFDYTTAAPAVTPEPSSFILLGSGLLGLAGIVRRRSTRT